MTSFPARDRGHGAAVRRYPGIELKAQLAVQTVRGIMDRNGCYATKQWYTTTSVTKSRNFPQRVSASCRIDMLHRVRLYELPPLEQRCRVVYCASCVSRLCISLSLARKANERLCIRYVTSIVM